MEPNKIDNKFKEAMQNRQITPTPAAWDRLDAMLTVSEEKKAAPTYNWLYVAAAIIGFITIAVIFFNSTQEMVDVKKEQIVYDNNTPIESKDSLKTPNQNEILAPKPSETVAEAPQNNPSNQTKSNSSNLKNNLIENKLIHQNPVANQQTAPNQNQNGASIINPTNEQSHERQRTDAVNQLNPIKTTNEQIANLDNPKLGRTSIKVNASSLLSEVDGELELSFREKMLQKLDKNYQNVKVALSNRNQKSNVNE